MGKANALKEASEAFNAGLSKAHDLPEAKKCKTCKGTARKVADKTKGEGADKNKSEPCEKCDDTGLEPCDDKKDCTNDGYTHFHAMQQCTGPCTRCAGKQRRLLPAGEAGLFQAPTLAE